MLDIDEEVSKLENYTACGVSASSQEPSSNGGNLTFPFLNNIKPYLYAKSISGNLSFFENKFQHSHLKFLTTGTSVDGLMNLYCETLEVANATTWTSSSYRGFKCNTLILDKLSSISLTNNDGSFVVREFIAPVLTKIQRSSTSYPLFGSDLITIYLPSLSKLPDSTIFKSATLLRNLTLGADFKSSINLQSCPYLSKQSVLDLFEKLAVLTEEDAGTTYRVYLPTWGPSDITRFTEDELNIARDKGWTVS